MPDMLLRQKLGELCRSPSTLLWLEGATHDRVLGVSLQSERLVLQLDNGTTRVVAFEKFAVTSVGLQFWSSGRPGVLYKWDQVPKATFHETQEAGSEKNAFAQPYAEDALQAQDATGNGDDDGHEPPPGLAA